MSCPGTQHRIASVPPRHLRSGQRRRREHTSMRRALHRCPAAAACLPTPSPWNSSAKSTRACWYDTTGPPSELQLLTPAGRAAAAAGRRRPQWAHEACQRPQCPHRRLAPGACGPPANRCRSSCCQERRRVEEAYVQGLRKLANKRPPDDSSDLGYRHISAPSSTICAD